MVGTGRSAARSTGPSCTTSCAGAPPGWIGQRVQVQWNDLHVRLLSPKTVQLMTVDHLNGIAFQPGTGMGLGFSVLEDLGARGTLGSVGEFGWGGAYHSTYWVDPVEKLVVVYLTQTLNTGPLDDFNKLRSGIYQALVESNLDE